MDWVGSDSFHITTTGTRGQFQIFMSTMRAVTVSVSSDGDVNPCMAVEGGYVGLGPPSAQPSVFHPIVVQPDLAVHTSAAAERRGWRATWRTENRGSQTEEPAGKFYPLIQRWAECVTGISDRTGRFSLTFAATVMPTKAQAGETRLLQWHEIWDVIEFGVFPSDQVTQFPDFVDLSMERQSIFDNTGGPVRVKGGAKGRGPNSRSNAAGLAFQEVPDAQSE